MIENDKNRAVVATGMSEYVGCPVVRSHQNTTNQEEGKYYPRLVYTITTLMSENKGTFGEYADGIDRKPFTQVWSFTSLSDDYTESVNNALKAHEWLDHVGNVYLYDNGIVVQSVGSITNRDNILTTEYEYRHGFDVVISLVNEVENPIAEAGEIESLDLGFGEIEKPQTAEVIE